MYDWAITMVIDHLPGCTKPSASKGGLFKTGRCCSGSCYPAKVDPYCLHHKNIMGNYGKSLKSL